MLQSVPFTCTYDYDAWVNTASGSFRRRRTCGPTDSENESLPLIQLRLLLVYYCYHQLRQAGRQARTALMLHAWRGAGANETIHRRRPVARGGDFSDERAPSFARVVSGTNQPSHRTEPPHAASARTRPPDAATSRSSAPLARSSVPYKYAATCSVASYFACTTQLSDTVAS